MSANHHLPPISLKKVFVRSPRIDETRLRGILAPPKFTRLASGLKQELLWQKTTHIIARRGLTTFVVSRDLSNRSDVIFFRTSLVRLTPVSNRYASGTPLLFPSEGQLNQTRWRECHSPPLEKKLPRAVVYNFFSVFNFLFSPFNELLVLCFVFFGGFFLELLTPKESVMCEVFIIFILDRFF